MIKRVKAFLLALVMMVLSVCTAFGDNTTLYAADGITVKLHYNRPDNDYSGWMVWFWPEGQGGADYQFAEEDGEQVATLDVAAGTMSVGYIIKTSSWAKDVDADQYIDIASVMSGTVHYYVESGEPGGKIVYGDDVTFGTRTKSATCDGAKTITVTMTGEIAEGELTELFAVLNKDGDNIEIASIVEGTNDNEFIITLAENVEENKSYYLTYEGNSLEISMPNPYSTEKFENNYTYDGDDLGANYTKESTTFKVWAPTAESVTLNLYTTGSDEEEGAADLGGYVMEAAEKGVWTLTIEGDLLNVYYTYTVCIDGENTEACDPYAKATGVNGNRAMVVNLDSTDPEGWENDSNPHAGENITDAIIYEMHVRDASIGDDSGVSEANKGKFLGLTETGTTVDGMGDTPTVLDHMKDLGITHLHLLPFYDYGSIDESSSEDAYNWGYDPKNYNVPEGSYSSNPYDGNVRITEAKQMVQALHENGISVVMDVVYNHVYDASSFCFNQIVPGYFSRINDDGSYSNGSGCGNDTASERSMVKKYIVDSVVYWADEYHIDGFRFDLVGLLDTETINAIIEEVHKTHPDVIFYGEGWTMSTDVTKDGYTMATQVNASETPEFAYFNDSIRDALKGSVFDQGAGFVSGATERESLINSAFLGASDWGGNGHEPSQTVNYASCHDNNTLYDRLKISRPDASRSDIIKMNNLAAAIYMMSEGIPFMQAGEEMLRSKVNADGSFNENSYNAGDSVNAINWASLESEDTSAVYEYYKGLIAFRKAHGALRLMTSEDVANTVTVIDGLEKNVVAYSVKGGINGETAEEMYLVFNANEEDVTVTLPEGAWDVYINGELAGTEVIETIKGGDTTVSAISALVLVKSDKDISDGSDNGNGDTYTGLLKQGDTWYYVENGVIKSDYTGLCKRESVWYYVEKGAVNFNYTGLCKHNENWFYVKNGAVKFDYTGLCKHNGNWFYVKNGVVDFTITGLCKYNGNWFYVKNGVVKFDYTGLCKFNGNWFYVKNGVVSFTSTGLCKYNGNWFCVKNGVVKFDYTGLCKFNGNWFYVKNGVVKFNYTGLCKHNGSWFYVKNGVVNFKYTGYVDHAGSKWYVKSGVIQKKA